MSYRLRSLEQPGPAHPKSSPNEPQQKNQAADRRPQPSGKLGSWGLEVPPPRADSEGMAFSPAARARLVGPRPTVPTGRVLAVLGPTNTGKTHLAVERMLGHRSGVIGFPLRLLAREVFDRVRRIAG